MCLHVCVCLCAFMCVDGTSDTEIVRYLEMCLALGSVSHPNVMTIIGISFNNIGAFSMIYPYFEEHDLLTHLRKKRSNIASGKGLQVCGHSHMLAQCAADNFIQRT